MTSGSKRKRGSRRRGITHIGKKKGRSDTMGVINRT